MPSPSALGIAFLARNLSPPCVVARLLPPSAARFSFCQVINVKPLKIVSFHLCHIYLGLGKLPHLSNELCNTVGEQLQQFYK